MTSPHIYRHPAGVVLAGEAFVAEANGRVAVAQRYLPMRPARQADRACREDGTAVAAVVVTRSVEASPATVFSCLTDVE